MILIDRHVFTNNIMGRNSKGSNFKRASVITKSVQLFVVQFLEKRKIVGIYSVEVIFFNQLLEELFYSTGN